MIAFITANHFRAMNLIPQDPFLMTLQLELVRAPSLHSIQS